MIRNLTVFAAMSLTAQTVDLRALSKSQQFGFLSAIPGVGAAMGAIPGADAAMGAVS